MTSPAASEPLPVWLRPRFVILVLLLLSAIKLVAAAATGLVKDEGYYTLWSMHLDFGYYDHPPAVAWMIALGRAIADNSELGVRLLAVIAGLIGALALYRTGRLLLDARTAALATLWFTLTLGFALGFITTPDTPSVLFWTLTIWAVAEFVAHRNANWWLLAGLCAGMGLNSKLTNAFLGVGLLLFLISSAERRRWFGLWQVWAGGALAVLVFAPNLWWNAQHGWASFLFQGGRAAGNDARPNVLANLGEFIAGQALVMGPILLILTFVGLILFLMRRAPNGLALPILTSLPALAYFLAHTLHSRVEANWLLPLWPSLALVGAWVPVNWRPSRWGAAVRTIAMAQAPLGAALAAVIFAQALWQPIQAPNLDRTNEMRGWPETAAAIASLAAANDAAWVGTQSYELTGPLTSYLLFADSDLVVRQIDQRHRYTFEAPLTAADFGRPILLVRSAGRREPRPPDDLFASARLLQVVTRSDRSGPIESYAVFLVADPTPTALARAAADF